MKQPVPLFRSGDNAAGPCVFKAPPDNGCSDTRTRAKVSCWLLALLSAGLALPALGAPQLQLSIWDADPSGTVTEQGTTFDLRNDLGARRDRLVGLELQWELSRWGQLDARVQQIDLRGEGEITIPTTLFGLIPIGTEQSPVVSRVNVDEWSLRWLPLQWGALEAGSSLRYLNGVLDAQEGENAGALEVNDVLPLLSLQGALPFGPGFTATLGGDWIGYNGDQVYELEAALGWAWDSLRIDLGWRLQRYDVGTGGSNAIDLTLRGILLRWGWAFGT